MANSLLSGKKAIVTGGTGEIGSELVRGLAGAGSDVCIHYHSQRMKAELLAEEVRSLGVHACVVNADLTDPGQVEAFADAAVEALGGCNVLFNHVGRAWQSPLLEISPTEWRETFARNLDSAFYTTRWIAPYMVDGAGGKIINTGSIVAELATTTMVHYCAAKAGLHMLTKAAAVALAPHGITVNAIAPGVVTTQRMQTRLKAQDNRAAVTARTPMGTLVAPTDLTGLAVFLASNLSDHITGQILVADHGYSLQGLEWS